MDVAHVRVNMFFVCFSKRRVEVLARTSVGKNVRRTSVGDQNLGRTSIGEEEIKKFIKSAENCIV